MIVARPDADPRRGIPRRRFLLQSCAPRACEMAQRYSWRRSSQILARFHRFPLHQPWIIRMRSKKIKITVHEFAQSFARRTARGSRGIDCIAQLAEKILQHGAMQPPLDRKIIVKHRLIRVRRGGDFLRARPRQALRAKICSAAARMRCAVAGFSVFRRPRFICHASCRRFPQC